MKKLWQPADIIDLYALLHLDDQERSAGGHTSLAQRDRNIYLHEILTKKQDSQLPNGQAQDNSPSFLVRQWLSVRRRMIGKEPNPQTLPGILLQETLLTARWLLILGGLFSGIFAAGAFLVYTGKAPLNVSAFFGLFILLPFLFLLLQFILFFLRFIQKQKLLPGGLSALTGRLLVRGMQRLQKKLQQSTSGKNRLESAAFIGKLSITLRHSPDQATLLLWPAFILLQWAAVGFNLGLLGTTLAKVVFSDVAFAWQSSLQLSPEFVASTVQWISLPWSWLPQACPDLAQIQGSQLIFKEGIAHMATEDLRAWWPFLCLSIFFYGLLPRLLLIILGGKAEHRNITRLVDRIPDVKRIIRRMLQPQLETTRYTAVVQKQAPKPKLSSSPVRPAPPARPSPTIVPTKPAPITKPAIVRSATTAPPKAPEARPASSPSATLTRDETPAQIPTTARPAPKRPAPLTPPTPARPATTAPAKAPVARPASSPSAPITRDEPPAQIPTTARPTPDEPALVALPTIEHDLVAAPPKAPVARPASSPSATLTRDEPPAQVPATARPAPDEPALVALPTIEQDLAAAPSESPEVTIPSSPSATLTRDEPPAQVPATARPAPDEPALLALPTIEHDLVAAPSESPEVTIPSSPSATLTRDETPAQVPATARPTPDEPALVALPTIEQDPVAAPSESPEVTTAPTSPEAPDSSPTEASLKSPLTEENNFLEVEIPTGEEEPSTEETLPLDGAWPQDYSSTLPESTNWEPAEEQDVQVSSCSLALIPDELLEECPAACQEELIALLALHQSAASLRVQAYNLFIPESSPAALLSGLLQEDKDQSVEQALFVQEAWQPPLREHETMIHTLRDPLGPEAEIFILLIGKPNPATILTPADPAQVKVWQQKMQALADPNLFVHPLLCTNKDPQ